MTLLGVLFMIKVAARDASSQNLRGIEAPTSKERPTSTMCLYFLSADPFY
jgi:hypothetical protein